MISTNMNQRLMNIQQVEQIEDSWLFLHEVKK